QGAPAGAARVGNLAWGGAVGPRPVRGAYVRGAAGRGGAGPGGSTAHMRRESPVKIEYTLTPEDFAATVHERVQNSPGKPRWAQYGSLAAIFPALLSLLSLGAMLVAQGFPWPVAAGVTLLGLLLGGLCFVVFPPFVFQRPMAGVFPPAPLPPPSPTLCVP